jgi:hypothetical protein
MKTIYSKNLLFLKPSALIPILMSVMAFSLVIAHAAIYGIVKEADEGTAAHIFQLLMVAQLPIIAFFGLKWLKKSSKQTLWILSIQFTAWLIAIAAVYWLT